MFRAWIDPDILKKAISPVTALVDEAQLHLEEGGMRIQTVDSANVGAVSLDLLAEGFHSYETDGGKVTLDLDRFEEIISKGSKASNFMLELDEETRKFIVSVEGYEFELSLLLPESAREGPDPYDIETPATVTIQGSELTEAIRMASMFSDNVRIGVDQKRDVFYLNAKGDSDSMYLTLSEEDLEEIEVAKAYGNYSLNYLSDIRKAIPSNSVVTLGLGQGVPMKIQYEIADENGRITYGLAPRT